MESKSFSSKTQILRIFKKGMKKFPDNLDEIFNIILVLAQGRKTILLEIHNPIQEQIAQWIKNLPNIETKSWSNAVFVFLKNTYKSFDLSFSNNKHIGQILGYQCSGQIGSRYQLEYTLTVPWLNKTESFYIEVCDEYPNMDIVNRQLEEFQRVATMIEGEVKYEITFHIIDTDILDFIKEDDIDSIILHRQTIVDVFEELGFVFTANFFKNSNSILEYYDKCKLIWQIILLFIIYDPLSKSLTLSDKDAKNLEYYTQQWERQIYNLIGFNLPIDRQANKNEELLNMIQRTYNLNIEFKEEKLGFQKYQCSVFIDGELILQKQGDTMISAKQSAVNNLLNLLERAYEF